MAVLEHICTEKFFPLYQSNTGKSMVEMMFQTKQYLVMQLDWKLRRENITSITYNIQLSEMNCLPKNPIILTMYDRQIETFEQ